eukprot:Seg1147.2 transcript_id=Seg1147.2/GoldUCD/mRNA.D3Y31 product="Calcium/calmodulin-dependent protein kinase kinase 1" protein_id=Seg1147.2/GoldUCD/D3Y31
MGSGCTKHTTASNVVKPIEDASTISVDSNHSRTRVKKFTHPLKSAGNEAKPDLNETFTISPRDAKFSGVNNNEVKRESVAHQTFTKENIPPNSEESNRANSAGSLNISGTKTQGRSRSCDESLKHYDRQTNLLECKPSRKRSNDVDDDDVFGNETAASGSTEQPHGKKMPATSKSSLGLPPALPRRYRRQPTIENSVCFQEDDQINHYQIQEEIGRGSFATVYKCRSLKNDQEYAMKVISKKRLIRKNGLMARHPRKSRANPLDVLHREIAILKKVDHPNIVKLVEVIDDPEIDNVYMVFEMMDGGPVQEIPTENPMNEAQARRYFRDMVIGLEYLHHTKIIHRDIKPTNLLLDTDDRIKIADFGVSDIFEGDDDMLNRFAGSPAFQAPEATAGTRAKFSGKGADIWAMGVTLFSFIYGQCPFYDTDMLTLYEKIKNDPFVFPEEPVVDPQLQDLISRLLAKDPKQRIKMQDIKEHPWLTQCGREPLPATADHCITIEVTDEDVKNSITLISKLSSLVLVKTMLKRRTFSTSKKDKRTSARSNSTPDISLSEQNFNDLNARVSKSATSLLASKKFRQFSERK